MLISPLLEKALRTAALAHRDQTRKASDLPYLVHPAAVVLILVRAGFDDDCLLAAAVLHDVVEDTALTLDDLGREFPQAVGEIVSGASEIKTDSSGRKRSWHERKAGHIEAIASASLGVAAVVLADKLHNLTSMLFDLDEGQELWSRFNASRDDVLKYHRDIVRAAGRNDPRIEKLTADCLAAVDRLSVN